MKHDYETKLNDMERRFLLLISENERKHQFAHEELQILCKNNEKVIEVLKNDNKNMKEEMIHHLKDQVECTRTHGDVKRKWIENEDDFDNNEEKKSKIETEVNPAQRLEKMEMLMDYCRGRLERLEDSSKEIKTNQENTTTNLQELKYRNHHKFLETELINLKNFIIKERMVNKNVKKHSVN